MNKDGEFFTEINTEEDCYLFSDGMYMRSPQRRCESIDFEVLQQKIFYGIIGFNCIVQSSKNPD